MTNLSRRKFLKFLATGVGAAAASPFIPLTALSAQVQYENQDGMLVPKNWKEGRPYWDMPVDQDQQILTKSKKTLEYQFNPFHQPNEIYGKETCHGGGSYDNSEIGQSDVDAAQSGVNHFALDVTGNNIINAEDATEIGNFIKGTTPILQSHWNFLSENEKLSWFTKMANIYTLNQKQYIVGDENTRYISGNFATEFALRMQGYNKELTDLLGGIRKDIPSKYDKGIEFNGRGNIPVYFVNFVRGNEGHGMNWFLAGEDPLNFEDGRFYEPQTNQIVDPRNYSNSINSTINIYKLENFGGSSWGEDMPSRVIGDPQETTKLIKFRIGANGDPSLEWWNESHLLTTKPTVSIGSELNMPKDYWLGNNYPNPFNPNTKIPYEVYKQTKMSLDLYDMKGRHIRNLEKGIKQPGAYIENFNGSNLPSGNYIVNLKTSDGYNQSRKISLVK